MGYYQKSAFRTTAMRFRLYMTGLSINKVRDNEYFISISFYYCGPNIPVLEDKAVSMANNFRFSFEQNFYINQN